MIALPLRTKECAWIESTKPGRTPGGQPFLLIGHQKAKRSVGCSNIYVRCRSPGFPTLHVSCAPLNMPDETMKQWVTAQNGLDNLTLTTGPKPTPASGEVVVKINTVSLNYRDTEVVMGLYGHHASISGNKDIVPCSDICGTITASKSDRWKEGQRVMAIFNQTHLTGQIQAHDMTSGLGLPLPGVLCEYRAFPAESLVAVPDFMSDEEACNLPIAAVTAWMAINGMRPLGQPAKGGETVLIQGTGGVAIAGLQIAHAAGLRTIVTSSSDEKLEKAKKMGADFTINYKTTRE